MIASSLLANPQSQRSRALYPAFLLMLLLLLLLLLYTTQARGREHVMSTLIMQCHFGRWWYEQGHIVSFCFRVAVGASLHQRDGQPQSYTNIPAILTYVLEYSSRYLLCSKAVCASYRRTPRYWFHGFRVPDGGVCIVGRRAGGREYPQPRTQ